MSAILPRLPYLRYIDPSHFLSLQPKAEMDFRKIGSRLPLSEISAMELATDKGKASPLGVGTRSLKS
jgi:hypothetical protein